MVRKASKKGDRDQTEGSDVNVVEERETGRVKKKTKNN